MTKVKTFFCTVAVASALVACGDDNPFQVIEDTEFAASLGVDLDQMQMLSSGVYIQDIAVGAGDEALLDSLVYVTYAGYLTDGTLFDSGQFPFTVGQNEVIDGFEAGAVGMMEDGRRLIVIPPAQAYGDVARSGIPAGSILVFDIMVDSIGASPVAPSN